MSLNSVMFIYNQMTFFHHVINPLADLTSEFTMRIIDSLDSFASTAYGDEISSLSIGNQQIFMVKVPLQTPPSQENFSIVMLTDKATSEKKTQRFLQQFKTAFLSLYSPQDVINWDGSILQFIPFKNVINKILEREMEPGIELTEKYIRDEFLKSITSMQDVKECFCYLISDKNGNVLEHYATRTEYSDVWAMIKIILTDLQQSKDISWEGIVPLLEQRQISYVQGIRTTNSWLLQKYSIPENEFLIFFLAYIMNDKYQFYLPKIIPMYRQTFALPLLAFKQSSDLPLDASMDQLSHLMNTTSFIDVVIQPSTYDVRLNEIMSLKDNDMLLHALIVNEPLALVGDEYITRRVINQMMLFSPHRHLRIVEFPKEIVSRNEADVVCVTPQQKDLYKDFIVVDLGKMRVKNGVNNGFCRKVLDQVKKLDDPFIITLFIRRKINWLISKSTMIRNLAWGKKLDARDILAIRADLEAGAEELVLLLSQESTSILQSLCDQLSQHIPISKLILDPENFIQFNTHKILISHRLTSEQTQFYLDRLIQIGTIYLGSRMVQTMLKHEGTT